MVDRTPQQFGGVPDGTTDSTAAIQAAVDAWQPGDQVVLSGGNFRTSGTILIPHSGLVLRGDGAVTALAPFPAGGAMLEISGQGVRLDADGLLLDQADQIQNGVTILSTGAVGLEVGNLVSRGTQRAFLLLADNTTDLLLHSCDHLGNGYGVLAVDPQGLARLTFRDTDFVHPGGSGSGDGIELACATHGAQDVSVLGCSAQGYIGEAISSGIGFGFSRVTDGRIIGCAARNCEGDGFHFERESHRWLCADLIARDIGPTNPTGGNGSGLIAYDSDDITVVLMVATNCAFHGIALSGEGLEGEIPSQARLNGLVERCTVDETRRDGIHMTAQMDFRIERNWIRDPSMSNPGDYAGIHITRQGTTSIENADGSGSGNVVVLSGQSTPKGEIVVRPESIQVTINGISGSEPFADGTFWADGTGWVEAA